MEYLFLTLAILSAAGLALGLIRPGLVMPGGSRATRGRALLGYGLAAVVSFALFVVTADSSLRPGRPGQPPAGTASDAGTEQNKQVFARLAIESVTVAASRVTVTGTTDLPEGSRLSVDFDVAGPPDTESDMAVGEETTVRGGRFSVAITPPRTPAFARGSYVVTVLFSPRAQSGEVPRRVGKDGENLAGPSVLETFGFRVLQVKKEVKLKL